MTEDKEKIINAFNNAWNKKIASENSYGKLASKEMFENKEVIIIDGVDVAGCNFFIEDYQRANNIEGRYEHCKNVCELNGDNYFYCEMNKNCYHKQLKRLEQENKELKAYKDINEDFKQAWYELNEKYKQLRSALEEIMEIAKFAQCLPCGSGNLEDCLNCDDEITNNGQFCMEKRIHEIKTKCVEVLTP